MYTTPRDECHRDGEMFEGTVRDGRLRTLPRIMRRACRECVPRVYLGASLRMLARHEVRYF